MAHVMWYGPDARQPNLLLMCSAQSAPQACSQSIPEQSICVQLVLLLHIQDAIQSFICRNGFSMLFGCPVMFAVSAMPHPCFAQLWHRRLAQHVPVCFAPPQEGSRMSWGCYTDAALPVSPACPSRSRQPSIITWT